MKKNYITDAEAIFKKGGLTVTPVTGSIPSFELASSDIKAYRVTQLQSRTGNMRLMVRFYQKNNITTKLSILEDPLSIDGLKKDSFSATLRDWIALVNRFRVNGEPPVVSR